MRILSLCAVLLLIFSLAFPAFAVEFDPYEYGTVSIDGDNEVVTIRNQYSTWYWRARFDGSSSNISSSSGQSISYSVTMAELDNTIVEAFPFGYQGMTSSDGIPSGSRIEGDFDFSGTVFDATQTFSVRAVLYLVTYDSNGSQLNSVALESETYSGLTDQFSFGFRPSFDASSLSGSSYWAFVLGLDFSEVANDSDNVKITVGATSGYFLLSIPYSQLYQLQQQGEKTNKLLQQIDSAMQENGQKLDEIMNNTVPSVRPDGQDKVDDLDDSEAVLRDDASSGLDEGLGILYDALDILVTYTQAFSALGLIFGYFAGIPFFSALLYLSFALGILATILGVGLSVASRFGNSHSNRVGKSSSGGITK